LEKHVRTREEAKAARAFHELSDKAGMDSVIRAWPNDRRIQQCLEKGEPIPDHLLPGRFLEENLDLEEREDIKSLRADLIQDRLLGA
jgi:hypothetical protein